MFGSAFGVTWRMRAAYDVVTEEQDDAVTEKEEDLIRRI